MLSNDEEITLKEIAESLAPFVLLIKSFSKSDANYSNTDDILEFVIDKLSRNKDIGLSKYLYESLIVRVSERRIKVLATALSFLSKRHKFGQTHHHLEFSDRDSTIRFIANQFDRLYLSADKDNDFEKHPESKSENSEIENEYKDIDLQKELEEFRKAKLPKQSPDSIFEEIEIFEKHGTYGAKLMDLKNSLESIPPTSILPERCFSMAGNFARKRRNRISDQLLDALIIMCNF